MGKAAAMPLDTRYIYGNGLNDSKNWLAEGMHYFKDFKLVDYLLTIIYSN